MARTLKHQSHLVVLQLSLDRSSSKGIAVFTLQKNGGTLTEIRIDYRQLGLPDNLRELKKYQYRGPSYAIPDSIVQNLKQHLAGVLDPDIPLWLQLKDDCGNLVVIPWERLLQPALDVPILRLPYFDLKTFSATSSSLDMVLCSSSAEAKEAIPIVEELEKLIRQMLAARLREKMVIHVFTDRFAFHSLSINLSNIIEKDNNSGVRIYSPYNSPDPQKTSSEDPWLSWIISELQGRSVDLAHFLCHGYPGTDQGALAFQNTPVSKGDHPEPTRFVGPQHLAAFGRHLGVWSIGFSSPVNNFSGSGLRLLADQLARLRTGPVLYHEIARDPNYPALVGAYRFLCNQAQDALPYTPALALYCHPNRVKRLAESDSEENQRNLLSQYTLAKGETLKIMESGKNTPTWVAASQRYLEQSVANLLDAEANSSVSSATQEGMKAALNFLSDTLERHASAESGEKENSV